MKKRKKVFEFYIFLAAGLSISFVVAACMGHSVSVNHTAEQYGALNTELAGAEQQFSAWVKEHEQMMEAHGLQMGDHNDSTHLSLEQKHMAMIEADRTLLSKHKMSIRMMSDWPSLKKEGSEDENVKAALTKEQNELQGDFEKIRAGMQLLKKDHEAMLEQHQQQ